MAKYFSGSVMFSFVLTNFEPFRGNWGLDPLYEISDHEGQLYD